MFIFDVDSLGHQAINTLKFEDNFLSCGTSLTFNLNAFQYLDPEDIAAISLFNCKWDVSVYRLVAFTGYYSYTFSLFPLGFTTIVDSVCPSLKDLCDSINVPMVDSYSTDVEFPFPHKNCAFGGLLQDYRRQLWEYNVQQPDLTTWIYHSMWGVISQSYKEALDQESIDIYQVAVSSSAYVNFAYYEDSNLSRYTTSTFPTGLSFDQYYAHLFNKKVSFESLNHLIIGKKYKLTRADNPLINLFEGICIGVNYNSEARMYKYHVVIGILTLESLPNFSSGIHKDQTGGGENHNAA